MAIGKFLAPLNGQMINKEQPYVDDIFDPLFNAEVRDYYKGLYGPIGGIGAGYAAMLDNALTGRKGILGPGMGILSTFGRSMDKADDFILGGLTEGVNALGQLTGGTNEVPVNPIENIFVNDYNYEGTKLMAAAGNAMAKLAGVNTPLTEQDFQSIGDKVMGTTIDLATDPGIMGGQLMRLNKGTPVGKMGQILNDYDNVMADVAGNMAFPGGKALVGKGLSRIRDFLGASSSAAPIDTVIKTGPDTFTPVQATSFTSSLEPETLQSLQDMATDYVTKEGINPILNPDEYAIYEDIVNKTSLYDEKGLQTAFDNYLKQQNDIKTFRSASTDKLSKKVKDYNDLVTNQAYKGIDENPTWFAPKQATVGSDDYINSLDLNDPDQVEEFWDYVQDSIGTAPTYNFGKIQEHGDFYEYLKYLEEEFGIDEAKNEFLKSKYSKVSSPFNFSQSGATINSYVGKEKLDLLNLHVGEFLSKHPEGFDIKYLRDNLGNDIYIPVESNKIIKNGKTTKLPRTDFFEQIRQFTRGYTFDTKSKKYLKTTELPSGNLNQLLNFFKSQKIDIPAGELEGKITAEGLIPWIRNNQDVLEKTQYGKDLITLADNLDADVFSYDTIKETGLPGIGEDSSLIKVINPIFNGSALNTPEAMERFAKTFPNFELTLNPAYRGTSYENLYKHYAEYRKTNKLYGAPYTTLKMSTPLAERATKILKEPKLEEHIPELGSELATLPPQEFAKDVTKITSLQDNTSLSLFDNTFKSFKESWGLPDDMPPDEFEIYVKTYGSREDKTLFQLWNASVQSKLKNKLGQTAGALNVDVVKTSKKHVDDIVKAKKYTNEQIAEYISRKDIAEGVTIKGDSFLESIFASNGFKEFPVPTRYTKEQADVIADALKANVDKVNKNGNILKFIDVTGEDNVRRLAIAFDTENLNIKKDINKIYSFFGKKDLGLEDVILRPSINNPTKFDSTELDTLFQEIRNGSEMLATKLGYQNFNPNYIAHVMEDTPEASKLFNGIYKTLGIDKAKLEKICDALKEQDIASGKLQFGAIPIERSHLGYFGQYPNGFSTNLKNIHSNTFTKGMLDNTNVQTYFDLFVTDNFKLKNNFDSVDSLKNALFMKDKNGNLAGNLNSLSLVKPRYNADGKLIGFSRWNKFSDADLAKAYNDAETILVPDSVIGSLDRMCKKDARMSNKVYRFINKYLTVPYKFGILANPGFLAGNIQDAYFKQAVELSKKYGTTLEDELTNVAMSMRHVTELNNNFADIFEEYKTWLKDTDLRMLTDSTKPAGWYEKTFKKSKNSLDILTPDTVLNDKEMYNAFKFYINGHVTVDKAKMANLYLFLNSNQTSTLFKNNNRDLEDLNKLITQNPYAAPNNVFERIMYGDPSKIKIVKDSKGVFKEAQDTGFRSWGLFLNNPVSNGILKSSNTIENWMRSSTIINDLQHQGYTLDDICEILGKDKVTEKAIREKFKMSMNEAIATMHAANFDYDNVSEFMNKMSYILPFPTFYLKNLAFWADIFTNKPQLIDNVISVHEGLWSGKDTSKDEFTAQAKGRGAVPIGQQGNKHLTGIVKQTPYNSMFGAFNAVNNLKEDFAYRTNPMMRPFTRHLQNSEDVKYRPYNTQQYQKNIKMGDKDFSELSYMFHQLNPYERFVNTGLRTPGKIANNSYQLSDFLPSMFQPDFSKKSR